MVGRPVVWWCVSVVNGAAVRLMVRRSAVVLLVMRSVGVVSGAVVVR